MAFDILFSGVCPRALGYAARFVRGMLFPLVMAVALSVVTSACGDDNYKELPREIQQFVTEYFPGLGIAGYNESAGVYTVNLDNSASIVFTPALQWSTVEGNGNTLPQQFLYDQMPKPLYDYMVTTGTLDEVFSVTRNAGVYTVTFHNYIISYNVATEEISPVVTGR